MSQDFLQNLFLADEDAAKCRGALLKLARHMNRPAALTGGLAVGWHSSQNSLLSEKTALNDIDLVVEDGADIKTSLSEDFLIAHFHPSRPRGKILVQLVDEENGLRIDIFTSCSKTLNQRLQETLVDDLPLSIIAAEDLSAKLCAVLSSGVNDQPVDPKYFKSFNRLFALADLATLKAIWPDYRKASQPIDFEEAADGVRQTLAAHPERLQKETYSQDLNQRCPWCEESQLFPLAPRAKIFDILGYV